MLYYFLDDLQKKKCKHYKLLIGNYTKHQNDAICDHIQYFINKT